MSMSMTRPRFALLAALFLLLVPLCSADVKESSTGISFAESIKLPGASCAAKLAGLGPRVKKIGPAAVKVYAVGIYVDEHGAVSQLAQYKRQSVEDLQNNRAFYNDVRKSKCEKVMLLKMARKVGTQKMRDALAESLRPRMPNGGGTTASLSAFKDVLTTAMGGEDGSADKGMQLGFVCQADGLRIAVNGKAAGVVKGTDLSRALVDCYFDDKAVSPPAKKDFASGMFRILNG